MGLSDGGGGGEGVNLILDKFKLHKVQVLRLNEFH